MDPRCPTPSVGLGFGRPESEDVGEFLCCPFRLALLFELPGHRVAQFEKNLDVERGVVQPGVGQRPSGPVGGPVAFLQGQSERAFDDGTESDPIESGEASCQFVFLARVG